MSRLLLPLLATALLLAGCGGAAKTQPSQADAPPIPVHTATVEASILASSRPLPGTVRSVHRATVSAQVMGSVNHAALALGERVRAGQTVIQLHADALVAQVDLARAALDQATRDHQREADLLTRGAATAETVRSLDDQRRMATARLEAAAAQVAHLTVTAPFDGVVTQRFVEPGDLAMPGLPLFALEGDDREVELAVPESLTPLPVGAEVSVLIGAQRTTASVREASPAADPASRTRMVRLSLPTDFDAHTGQFARVAWPTASTSSLSVPVAALSPLGQMQRVFVVTHGRATLRLVKTGAVHEDNAAVLAGLHAGDIVILNPPAALRDGQAVTVEVSP